MKSMKLLEASQNVIIHDLVQQKYLQKVLLFLQYKSIYLEKILLFLCSTVFLIQISMYYMLLLVTVTQMVLI